MIITLFDQLVYESEGIQEFLDIDISDFSDNAELIKERGDKLSSYISRTGKMLSDAKYHLDEHLRDETMKVIKDFIIDNQLSASVQNSLINCLCRQERLLVNTIEQLNKTAKYQIKWCISRLSMAKEEMNNSRNWNK